MATQNGSRRARRRVHDDTLPARPIPEDRPEFRLQTRVGGRDKLEFDKLRAEKGASEATYLRMVLREHLAKIRGERGGAI